MIKSQTDEGLEEVTAPVGTSTENYDQSDDLEAPAGRPIPKSSTKGMLDNAVLGLEKLDFSKKDNKPVEGGSSNEEDEESTIDSLEPPPRRPVPKSSTLRMLDDALLELEKQMQDISKKDKPVEGGSSNVV